MSTFKFSSMNNWKLSRVLEVNGKMEFDTGKCKLIPKSKGQLTVTDRFTVHEDQIFEIRCSKNPRRAS